MLEPQGSGPPPGRVHPHAVGHSHQLVRGGRGQAGGHHLAGVRGRAFACLGSVARICVFVVKAAGRGETRQNTASVATALPSVGSRSSRTRRRHQFGRRGDRTDGGARDGSKYFLVNEVWEVETRLRPGHFARNIRPVTSRLDRMSLAPQSSRGFANAVAARLSARGHTAGSSALCVRVASGSWEAREIRYKVRQPRRWAQCGASVPSGSRRSI